MLCCVKLIFFPGVKCANDSPHSRNLSWQFLTWVTFYMWCNFCVRSTSNDIIPHVMCLLTFHWGNYTVLFQATHPEQLHCTELEIYHSVSHPLLIQTHTHPLILHIVGCISETQTLWYLPQTGCQAYTLLTNHHLLVPVTSQFRLQSPRASHHSQP